MGMDFSEIEEGLRDLGLELKNEYAVVQEPYQKLYFLENYTLLISLAQHYTFFIVSDRNSDRWYRQDGEYTAADIIAALNNLNLI